MTEDGRARAGPWLDWRAVTAGAAVTLVITAGPIAGLRLVVGDEAQGVERNLWVVAVIALFAAFAVGGQVAARRRPEAPLLHAATGAAVAFTVFTAYTLARRLLRGDGVSAPLLITLFFLFQINVSVAVLSGHVASRRSRRD